MEKENNRNKCIKRRKWYEQIAFLDSVHSQKQRKRAVTAAVASTASNSNGIANKPKKRTHTHHTQSDYIDFHCRPWALHTLLVCVREFALSLTFPILTPGRAYDITVISFDKNEFRPLSRFSSSLVRSVCRFIHWLVAILQSLRYYMREMAKPNCIAEILADKQRDAV